jgi:hypothetical protein
MTPGDAAKLEAAMRWLLSSERLRARKRPVMEEIVAKLEALAPSPQPERHRMSPGLVSRP